MALVNEGGSLRVVGGALGTGQACCCGGVECELDGTGCEQGFQCCPQMIAIVDGSAVNKNICLPLFLPEQDEFGRCCFNYGNNCIEVYKAECLCSFDGLRGVEVIFTPGASCSDGCENPFP